MFIYIINDEWEDRVRVAILWDPSRRWLMTERMTPVEGALKPIELLIRKELNAVVKSGDQAGNWKRSEWTKRVKEAVSKVGRARKYVITVHGLGDKTEPQWLFDMAWSVECGPKRAYLQRLVMIAEFEWNRKEEDLDWDFQKLMVGRADFRLFVFDQKRKDDVKRIMDRFIEQISMYQGTQEGDRYLLAGSSTESTTFQVKAFSVKR
jgi:hypothetical protein